MKPFLAIFALSSSLGWAGTNLSGGGRSVSGQLYDLYLASHSQRSSPQALGGFDQVVTRILEHTKTIVPGFARELEDTIREGSSQRKRWVFVDADLNCPDQVSLKVQAEVVACQSSLNVKIQRQRFNALSSETQGEVIVHEMVRGVAMAKKLSDDDAIYDLVPVLLKMPRASELCDELKRDGYGNYSTASEISEAQNFAKQSL
jgi:hypothetical protein